MTTAIDLLVLRGDCFKLLAACFYEPDRELFLREHLCENLTSLFEASQLKGAAEKATLMHKALAEQDDEDLKVEHARLFVGPFALLAPPYGSVYLEHGSRLMGDSTLAVLKAYQDNGLTLQVREAPDHVALELEFMHYLCLAEAEALAGGDKEKAGQLAVTQADFFEKLLRPWLGSFCQAIRSGTDNPFYRHLAECLEDFAAVDAASSLATAGLTELPEESHAR